MTTAPREPLGVITKRRRQKLPLKTKLAAALLQMVRPSPGGGFVPVIPYEEAKRLTADQIIARFRFDHNELHAFGGTDEPWNITPLPEKDHAVKTAKVDQPAVAKVKRLTEGQEEFRRALLAKGSGEKPVKQKRRWPSRPLRGPSKKNRTKRK